MEDPLWPVEPFQQRGGSEHWLEERKRNSIPLTGYGTQPGDPTCWMLVDGEFSKWNPREYLSQLLLNRRDWEQDYDYNIDNNHERYNHHVVIRRCLVGGYEQSSQGTPLGESNEKRKDDGLCYKAHGSGRH